jgi:hypothetical protein
MARERKSVRRKFTGIGCLRLLILFAFALGALLFAFCVPVRGAETNDKTELAERKEFIHFQYEVYKDDPNWVPPLRMSIESALDRKRHPFHEHATLAYFIAERNGRPVGRIAAIVNRAHNDFHRDRVGSRPCHCAEAKARLRRSCS